MHGNTWKKRGAFTDTTSTSKLPLKFYRVQFLTVEETSVIPFVAAATRLRQQTGDRQTNEQTDAQQPNCHLLDFNELITCWMIFFYICNQLKKAYIHCSKNNQNIETKPDGRSKYTETIEQSLKVCSFISVTRLNTQPYATTIKAAFCLVTRSHW